jgi:acid phosphatase (class B)
MHAHRSVIVTEDAPHMSRARIRRASPLWCAVAISLAACTHSPVAQPHADEGRPCQQESTRATVGEYLERLPPPPLVVGLDVDDTALFSTPAFLYAKSLLVPERPPRTGTPEDQLRAWQQWADALPALRDQLFEKLVVSPGTQLTPHERDEWTRFWTNVNTTGDAYSPPKASVREIVRRHLQRGDDVVFITARARTAEEALTRKLRSDFGDRVRVEFTGNRPKTDLIRHYRMAIFYGDADSDMTDAFHAGARGVRVLRSKYSSNPQPTSPGTECEWFVVVGSDL